VLPLAVFFASHHGIATLGDDSVSYLAFARHFAGSDGPLISPWLPYLAHFPPLFPMVLAIAGGADDLRRAHEVVAVFAALSLAPVCIHAARQLGSNRAAILVALLFLLTPTAWIGIKGILSESMYLFVSMCAIAYHEARLSGGRPRAAQWLLFGILLACAWLTRAVGLMLILAFVTHVAVGIARGKVARDFRQLIALLPVVVFVGAWYLYRPTAAVYQRTLVAVAQAWLEDPAQVLQASASFLYHGWLASFSAESDVPPVAKFAFSALGLLGLAGTLRRVRANRLDGWYVAFSLGVIFFWVFPEENMRRLLYPLLPLLLVHAGESVLALCRLCRLDRYEGRVLLAAWALPALLCLPAAHTVLEKSRDRGPGIPGLAYSYAGMTDYYTTINTDLARMLAAKDIAVLAGLESLEEVTPRGAKIMWMRPEYVALLGGREGVPWYFRWDRQDLARELRKTKADYLIQSRIFKADLEGAKGDPFASLEGIEAYASPTLSIRSVATGEAEFVLWKIDAARLDAYLKGS
jgi:hypothetical protein